MDVREGRGGPLFIAGCGSWLPPAVPVREAIAAGRYDPGEHARTCYESVRVAGDDAPPPVMAVRAGRIALDRSGSRAEDLAIVLHASSWYQGLDFWPASSYIHRELLGEGSQAPAMDVQQMSNGGLAAVELAASYLAAGSARATALVTAADRFCEPGFDRWRSDGLLYGDGAAAVVLSRRGGFARLRSLVSLSDTGLERLYRGNEPLGPVSGHAGWPVDIRRRREAALPGFGGSHAFSERLARRLREVVGRSLEEAGLGVGDLARVILPNTGLETGHLWYAGIVGVELSRTLWEWGRCAGHLGTADQLAGFVHLVETGAVRPGDRVLLVGIGAGFGWSCAVVELLERPAWARAAPGEGTDSSGRASQIS